MASSVLTALFTSLPRGSGVVTGKELGSELDTQSEKASFNGTETNLVSGVVSERLVLDSTLCAEVAADIFSGVVSCSASWETLAVEAVTSSVAELGVETVSSSVRTTVHVIMDDEVI